MSNGATLHARRLTDDVGSRRLDNPQPIGSDR